MQTIGERLEDARKKKGVSIRDAAEATKIRGEYLSKFEGNQFDIGLDDIYVRGFLKNYAVFLKLPADRLLGDYASLGHGAAKPRQPSREVYGRMDLSISSADEKADAPGGAAPQGGPAATQAAPHVPHGPGSSLPERRTIDPALVFKGGIALVALLALMLIFWLVKSLTSDGTPPPPKHAGKTETAASQAPEPTLTLVGLAPVTLKVTRQSDGVQLYSGPLAKDERKEFPNIPLQIESSAIESVAIDYKGRRYNAGEASNQKGHALARMDFSTH
jgi:transcriptional regulator with XRE-family HTH domain